MAFITELWESVFTPGTTPALIKATHASFILLILSLICLIFLSRSIHFINLLVISVLLYGSVIWFISELKQTKLKNNPELEKEGDDKDKETTEKEPKEPKGQDLGEAKSSSVNKSPVRKRKV